MSLQSTSRQAHREYLLVRALDHASTIRRTYAVADSRVPSAVLTRRISEEVPLAIRQNELHTGLLEQATSLVSQHVPVVQI